MSFCFFHLFLHTNSHLRDILQLNDEKTIIFHTYFQRGEATKMALAYAGVDYQEVNYNFGAAEGSDDHWGTQKSKLGLAFPNLPWYINDNVKLTQSNAILRQIGRKYNLFGKNVEEASEIDMLIDTAADIQQAVIKIIFNPDFVRTHFYLISSIIWVFL